jgi:hypothetical protein
MCLKKNRGNIIKITVSSIWLFIYTLYYFLLLKGHWTGYLYPLVIGFGISFCVLFLWKKAQCYRWLSIGSAIMLALIVLMESGLFTEPAPFQWTDFFSEIKTGLLTISLLMLVALIVIGNVLGTPRDDKGEGK